MKTHSGFESSQSRVGAKPNQEHLSTVTTNLSTSDPLGLGDSSVPVKSSELIVEDYDFLQIIGQGAFGTVFKAVCKATGEGVAIKYIKGSREGLREAQNMIRVPQHPNIVKLIAVYLSDEALFLVQELCSISLLDAAANMSPQDITSVLHQLAVVLDALHARCIIHRDIKPENVMLIQDGTKLKVKLIDFGLAAFDSTVGPNVRPAGTDLFMAPEMIRGTYDNKVDMWSLGITACFLLCGESPISPALESRRLYEQILSLDPSTIRFKKCFGESLVSIVKSLLNQDPHLRPNATVLLNQLSPMVN